MIKGDVSVAVNSLVLEATEKITLKVGQSSIVIDHCSIYINAPSMIYENSSSVLATGASAVTLQNVADATLAEPGVPVERAADALRPARTVRRKPDYPYGDADTRAALFLRCRRCELRFPP